MLDAYQSAYYEAYKEQILIRNRAYYAKNREYIIARKADPSISRRKPKKQKRGSPSKPTETCHRYYKPEVSNTFSIRYGDFYPFRSLSTESNSS